MVSFFPTFHQKQQNSVLLVGGGETNFSQSAAIYAVVSGYYVGLFFNLTSEFAIKKLSICSVGERLRLIAQIVEADMCNIDLLFCQTRILMEITLSGHYLTLNIVKTLQTLLLINQKEIRFVFQDQPWGNLSRTFHD